MDVIIEWLKRPITFDLSPLVSALIIVVTFLYGRAYEKRHRKDKRR